MLTFLDVPRVIGPAALDNVDNAALPALSVVEAAITLKDAEKVPETLGFRGARYRVIDVIAPRQFRDQRSTP